LHFPVTVKGHEPTTEKKSYQKKKEMNALPAAVMRPRRKATSASCCERLGLARFGNGKKMLRSVLFRLTASPFLV
jgi:hypothetical protein